MYYEDSQLLRGLQDFAVTEVNEPSVCTSEYTEDGDPSPTDLMSQFALTERFMDETLQILQLDDDHFMLKCLEEHIDMFSRIKTSSEEWGDIEEPLQDSKVSVGKKSTTESLL